MMMNQMMRRVVIRLFAQTVLLLILYVFVTLIGAVKFLQSDDPLALAFPYQQVGPMAEMLLYLTILTGLLGGGIYIVISERTDGHTRDEAVLQYAALGWTIFLALAFIAGMLDLLSGRHGLPLPAILSIMKIILAGILIIAAVRSVREWSSVVVIWLAGMAIVLLTSAAGLITSSDYATESLIRTFTSGLRLHVGFTLAAIALGYWLMHRFSNITPGWSESSLYIVAGFLTLAGLIVTLGPLNAFSAGPVTEMFMRIGGVIIPLSYMLLAAHSYRALSDRNATHTLSAHWYTLGLILFLLGTGILGTIATYPEVNRWLQGTRLTDLQTTLVALAASAVCMGVINQAGAELRGENRRITGLLPFWLAAGGILLGGFALAGAGLVQVYLERVLSVGYLETQDFIVPLYAGWVAGYVIFALGTLIYALGFYARRPYFTERDQLVDG